MLSRRFLAAACVLVLVAVGWLVPARPARAQTATPPIEITGPQDGSVTSLPRPNSGVQPERATERGGWLQLALVVLFIGFGAVAFFSIRRQGANARSGAARP